MNVAGFALRNLARRPVRTALTVLSIALGVAAIVSLTAIAWGFEASWQQASDARGTDLIVTRQASRNALPAPFVAAPVRQALQRLPQVAGVAALLSELQSIDEAPPMFVFGWESGSFLWQHLRLAAGRWPADDERALVLGTLAARMLGRAAGDTVSIEGQPFTVAGVYESPALIENGAAILPLPAMQALLERPGKASVISVRLAPGATETDRQAVAERVRAEMPGFVALPSGELVRGNAMVRIAKAMSGATMLIAGLVGTLVVLNAMLINVQERTAEIGVLRAAGWRGGRIVRLILVESGLLAAAGALAGVALGMGGALALAQLELLRGRIDPVFTPTLLAASIGLALAIGAAGGAYPAWRAVRLSPAAALRSA